MNENILKWVNVKAQNSYVVVTYCSDCFPKVLGPCRLDTDG